MKKHFDKKPKNYLTKGASMFMRSSRGSDALEEAFKKLIFEYNKNYVKKEDKSIPTQTPPGPKPRKKIIDIPLRDRGAAYDPEKDFERDLKKYGFTIGKDFIFSKRNEEPYKTIEKTLRMCQNYDKATGKYTGMKNVKEMEKMLKGQTPDSPTVIRGLETLKTLYSENPDLSQLKIEDIADTVYDMLPDELLAVVGAASPDGQIPAKRMPNLKARVGAKDAKIAFIVSKALNEAKTPEEAIRLLDNVIENYKVKEAKNELGMDRTTGDPELTPDEIGARVDAVNNEFAADSMGLHRNHAAAMGRPDRTMGANVSFNARSVENVMQNHSENVAEERAAEEAAAEERAAEERRAEEIASGDTRLTKDEINDRKKQLRGMIREREREAKRAASQSTSVPTTPPATTHPPEMEDEGRDM